jgi:hypothetical protein
MFFQNTRARAAVCCLGTLAAAGTVLLGTAVAGPATAASAAGRAPSASLTAAVTVARCDENQLIAGLHGYESGGQGSRAQGGFILTLTNNGQYSCSLNGYPGLGLQNARHRVLRSDVHWGSTIFARDPGRQLLVLSPGETASSSVSLGYVGSEHAVHSVYLEVTPPGAYDHAVLAIPDGLGNISGRNLYATAMARHTAYEPAPEHCCEG